MTEGIGILILMCYNMLNMEKNYGEQLKVILDAPLSPEVIGSYAQVALDQVVELVGDYTDDYLNRPVEIMPTKRANEDAAAHYFGLQSVDETLIRLQIKSDEITGLDNLIANAVIIDRTVVPPDDLGHGIVRGPGTYEKAQTIPRLKTMLFILQNHFDINVHDPNEFSLFRGEVTDGMIRASSYHVLEVPAVNRTVLACDEESNATFIFDSSKMRDLSIDVAQILTSSKQEIEELFDEHQGLGKKVIHSKHFVDNFIGYIESLVEDEGSRKQSVSLLVKKRGNGFAIAMSNDEIVNLAKEISPDKPLAAVEMSELSVKGVFVSMSTIRNRFGSVLEFTKLCGFEPKPKDMTNEELVQRMQEISPNKRLTSREIQELSKIGKFIASKTVCVKFGSVSTFQESVWGPSSTIKYQAAALPPELSIIGRKYVGPLH